MFCDQFRCQHKANYLVRLNKPRPMRNQFSILLAALLLTISLSVSGNPRTDPWRKDELNEKFMRTLTKNQCMAKAISMLATTCSSPECLKNLAGITGDCVTWAIGNDGEFCSSYDREYISSYCATNEMDARRCTYLYIGKTTMCKAFQPR